MKHLSHLTIYALAASLLACGGDPTSILPTTTEISENEYLEREGLVSLPSGIHLRDNIAVFEFDSNATDSWDYSTEGVIRIPSVDNAQVSGLKKGDIITSWGEYIVVVSGVQQVNGQTEVSVEPFVLSEAIYGDFSVPILAETREGGIGNIDYDKSLEISKDFFNWKNIQGSGAAELKVKGHLRFPYETVGEFKGRIPVVSKDYKCEGEETLGYCVDYIKVQLTLTMDALLDLAAKSTGTLSLNARKPDAEESIKLLNKLNDKIRPIPIGGGLGVLPQIIVPRNLSLNADASAEFGFNATVNAKVPLGVEYFNKGYKYNKRTVKWIPNNQNQITFTRAFEPTYSGEGTASIKAHVGIGIRFDIVPMIGKKVIGIKGFEISAKLNGEVVADPYDEKRECLTGKLYFNVEGEGEIRIYGKIKIWKWKKKFNWKLFKVKSKPLYEKEIASFKSDSICLGEQPKDGPAYLKLKWTASTDLDLIAKFPGGREVSPLLTGGNIPDGVKMYPPECYNASTCIEGEEHVEHIEWAAGKMKKGTYKVTVLNFDGRNAATYEILVKLPNGKTIKHNAHLSATKNARSEVFEFTY